MPLVILFFGPSLSSPSIAYIQASRIGLNDQLLHSTLFIWFTYFIEHYYVPGTVLYPKAVRLSKKLRFNIFLLQSLLFPAFVSPVMHNTSLALTDRCLSDCWETLFCFLFCIFATLFHFFSSPQGVCWDEVKVHVLVSLKRGFVNQCHYKKKGGFMS